MMRIVELGGLAEKNQSGFLSRGCQQDKQKSSCAGGANRKDVSDNNPTKEVST